MEDNEEHDEMMEFLREAQKEDLEHIRHAMNKLIDPLSKWMSVRQDSEHITEKDLIDLLNSLSYAQFIVQGLMYSYGFGIDCEHDDEEEEDEHDG